MSLWRAVCLVALLPGLSAAEQRDLGGADALFPLLLSPSGARSLSLGRAFEAVPGGAEASAYNPAGVVRSRRAEAAFHHEALLANSSRESLLLSLPTGPRGAMTASLAYVQYGVVQQRDAQGRALGAFQPADYGVGLGGGFALMQDLALGASVRALRQQLPQLSLRGVAADLGALAAAAPGFDLGLVLRLRPTQDAEGAGMNVKTALGGAYTLQHAATGLWLGAASVEVDSDRASTLHLGLEKDLSMRPLGVALRCGWSGSFPRSEGLDPSATVGAGLALGSWALDYAFAPMGRLGSAQQLSLTWRGAP